MCVDDFSRFTLVSFIREKSDTFDSFEDLCLTLKNEKNCNIGRIVRIRNDHGKEFEISIFFPDVYSKYDISHEFSSPRHHKKMMLLRGKSIHCKKWAVWCLIRRNCPSNFQQKQWTRLVTQSTMCTFGWHQENTLQAVER